MKDLLKALIALIVLGVMYLGIIMISINFDMPNWVGSLLETGGLIFSILCAVLVYKGLNSKKSD